MKIRKRYFLTPLIFLIGLLGLAFLVLNQRCLVYETWDPTGNYVAKVTYKSFYSFIPMAPGSSSDKPGYVEIFDKSGESMGEVSVPMLQLAGVSWEPTGASVQLIGEWHFPTRSCFYWDESGNHKIFVKGKEWETDK